MAGVSRVDEDEAGRVCLGWVARIFPGGTQSVYVSRLRRTLRIRQREASLKRPRNLAPSFPAGAPSTTTLEAEIVIAFEYIAIIMAIVKSGG